ncbi:MAG: hypothetical protein ACLUNZ_02535 [Evtepia sp.]
MIGYAFVALSLLTSFFCCRSRRSSGVLKCISNVWLGVLVYLIMTVGIAGFLRLVLKRTNFARKEHLFNQKHFILTGWLCLVIVVSLSVSGVVGARNLQTTDYQVTVHKAVEGRESLRVVLVADLHLGYSIGQWHMNNMVEKINALNPDLVVIAGDILRQRVRRPGRPRKARRHAPHYSKHLRRLRLLRQPRHPGKDPRRVHLPPGRSQGQRPAHGCLFG